MSRASRLAQLIAATLAHRNLLIRPLAIINLTNRELANAWRHVRGSAAPAAIVGVMWVDVLWVGVLWVGVLAARDQLLAQPVEAMVLIGPILWGVALIGVMSVVLLRKRAAEALTLLPSHRARPNHMIPYSLSAHEPRGGL